MSGQGNFVSKVKVSPSRRRWGGQRGRLLKVIVIACLVLLLGAGSAYAAYAWAQNSFWYGSHTAWRSKVASGDFDGDGRADAVSLYDRGSGKTSIYVFRSNGSSFVSRSSWWYGTMTASKCKLAVTDTNGDGKDDLLVLYNSGSGGSTIYRFTSSGSSFSKSTMYKSSNYKLYWSRCQLTAGDVDNDGNGDAIVQYDRTSGKSSMYVYKAPISARGTVVNASGWTGLSGVTVTVRDGSNAVIGSAVTGAGGSYALVLPAGTGYTAQYSLAGFNTVYYYNIASVNGSVRFLETVPMVSSSSSTVGNIGGTITDAFSGSGLVGVSVTLRQGMDNRTGFIWTGPYYTGASGVWSITGLSPGVYTAQLHLSGYTDTYFTVFCLPGVTTGNQNGSISGLLAGSQVRVVLTWGAYPSDLDSHLSYYPSGSSTRRWHIYYSNKIASASPTAALDVDDVTSYGPETVTISNRNASGTYRYSVFDFSHSGGVGYPGNSLPDSGAKVQVYTNAGLYATYNVPSSASGGLWKVFEIRNGTIVPINTVSTYTGGSANVP